MRADNEFLMAMIDKLNDIAGKCIDLETRNELEELIQAMADSLA